MATTEKEEEGSRIHVSCMKVQEFQRAIDVFARTGRVETMVFSPDRLQLAIIDSARQSALYGGFYKDFFEIYKVPEEIEANIVLADFSKRLHDSHQLHHVKLLHVKDTSTGQLHGYGRNPNGFEDSFYIRFVPSPSPCLSPQTNRLCIQSRSAGAAASRRR